MPVGFQRQQPNREARFGCGEAGVVCCRSGHQEGKENWAPSRMPADGQRWVTVLRLV